MSKINRKIFLLSFPILAGFSLFYIVPFLISLYYSLVDNVNTQNFIGLKNYISLINNKYFIHALINTLLFSIVSVILVITISLFISFFLENNNCFRKFFMLPMLLPTTAVIFVWDLFFGTIEYRDLCKSELGSFFTILPLYLLFLWKNTGFVVIVVSSALVNIEQEIKEAATLDGASSYIGYLRISIPCIKNELYFSIVVSLVNSFKIYKESSLLYEPDYPPDSIYMLQNFMNNHFQKLNYQILTSATVIFVIFISVLVILAFRKTFDYKRKR